MSTTLLLVVICAAMFVAYRIGKWEDKWQIELLQADNTRLSGEIHRVVREIERGDYQTGKRPPSIFIDDIEENITEVEDYELR